MSTLNSVGIDDVSFAELEKQIKCLSPWQIVSVVHTLNTLSGARVDQEKGKIERLKVNASVELSSSTWPEDDDYDYN